MADNNGLENSKSAGEGNKNDLLSYFKDINLAGLVDKCEEGLSKDGRKVIKCTDAKGNEQMIFVTKGSYKINDPAGKLEGSTILSMHDKLGKNLKSESHMHIKDFPVFIKYRDSDGKEQDAIFE